MGAAMSRPTSSTQTTSRSCSTRYWLLIGRPMRDVASQLIWRTSSSGRYSRTDSNSVPSPSGPRVRCPGSRKRPRRSAITSRRAAGTSGYTSTGAGSPRANAHAARPERTGAPGGRRGQVVPAPARCDELGVESGRAGRRRDRDVGRLRLPDATRARRVAGNRHRRCATGRRAPTAPGTCASTRSGRRATTVSKPIATTSTSAEPERERHRHERARRARADASAIAARGVGLIAGWGPC